MACAWWLARRPPCRLILNLSHQRDEPKCRSISSDPGVKIAVECQIGDKAMSVITTKDGVEIFYKDWGNGQPIVFSHGWPLSADDWDTQMLFFLKQGYRVIAHDRRGHGRSTQTSGGHDMDHY